MRTGMLASTLMNREHSVLWWSSTCSHQRKTLLYEHDVEVKIQPSFTVKLIHAGQYQHNISFQRYRHHRLLAKKFRAQANRLPTPAVIVCAFPPIELAYEAVAYAQAHRIPIIMDVRDLWPDIFVDKSPRLLRGVAKLMLQPAFWKTQCLLHNADSIVAVSQGYMAWAMTHAKRPRTNQDKVFYLGYDQHVGVNSGTKERLESFRRLVQDKVVFTFIGSFGHSYELRLLCDVAQLIAELGLSTIHFVLAGDGEQYHDIAYRAASLPNMSLLGWLNEPELRDLLALSHVGLSPCLHAAGSLPNKPFEYLSGGLPILSSLEGEMAHIIAANDIGFSYRRGDAKALYEHIIKLATDHALRERQACNALNLFLREFRGETIYEAYVDHVEQMAMRRKAVNARADVL